MGETLKTKEGVASKIKLGGRGNSESRVREIIRGGKVTGGRYSAEVPAKRSSAIDNANKKRIKNKFPKDTKKPVLKAER